MTNKTNNTFFEYICNYYDDIENDFKEGHGVIYACSFTDAMHNVQCYYDNIENVSIFNLGISDIYEFEEDSSIFSVTVNKNG